MASYTEAVNALFPVAAGQTLEEAGHDARHNDGNTAIAALAAYLDAQEWTGLSSNVGLTIAEVTVGVWSGDAPAGRTSGQNPIWFIPLDPANPTDPASPTDGIATPANLRAWDRLGPVSVDAL